MYSLIKQPKIFYVLPFRAFRLTVIYRGSGISWYDYKWTESELIDDILLSGLLHALQSMSEDVIKRGHIKEVILEEGVLIFQITEHTIIGLLSSKGSKVLRQGLQEFSSAFEQKFHNILKTEANIMDNFKSASELIQEHFEYIPLRV